MNLFPMSPRNIPSALAPVTLCGENMNILENGRPVKANLKNFCSSFWNAHMPFIRRGMRVGDNAIYFLFGDALTEDIIDTPFKQEGVVPIVMLKVMEELFLLLIG